MCLCTLPFWQGMHDFVHQEISFFNLNPVRWQQTLPPPQIMGCGFGGKEACKCIKFVLNLQSMILRHDLLCQILRKFKLGILMGEKPKNLKVKILKKYLTTASRDIIRNLWLEFHPDLDPDRIRVNASFQPSQHVSLLLVRPWGDASILLLRPRSKR